MMSASLAVGFFSGKLKVSKSEAMFLTLTRMLAYTPRPEGITEAKGQAGQVFGFLRCTSQVAPSCLDQLAGRRFLSGIGESAGSRLPSQTRGKYSVLSAR